MRQKKQRGYRLFTASWAECDAHRHQSKSDKLSKPLITTRYHKDEGIGLAKELIKLNFTLCATRGTAEYMRKHGMKCRIINKVSSGSPHIVDILDSKKIGLVINTGGGNSEHRLNDAIALRRGTLKNKVPYCTNMSTALACLEAIKSLKTKKLEVTSLQDI